MYAQRFTLPTPTNGKVKTVGDIYFPGATRWTAKLHGLMQEASSTEAVGGHAPPASWSGWVHRPDGAGGYWHQRWCTIRSSQVVFYRDADARAALGGVQLGARTQLLPPGLPSAAEDGFFHVALVCAGLRSVPLAFPTAGEASAFAVAVNEAAAAVEQQSAAASAPLAFGDAIPQGETLLRGELEKQTRRKVLKGWRKRTFAVRDGVLLQVDAGADERTLADAVRAASLDGKSSDSHAWDLAACTLKDRDSGDGPQLHLSSPGEPALVLRAADESETGRWDAALRMGKAQAEQRNLAALAALHRPARTEIGAGEQLDVDVLCSGAAGGSVDAIDVALVHVGGHAVAHASPDLVVDADSEAGDVSVRATWSVRAALAGRYRVVARLCGWPVAGATGLEVQVAASAPVPVKSSLAPLALADATQGNGSAVLALRDLYDNAWTPGGGSDRPLAQSLAHAGVRVYGEHGVSVLDVSAAAGSPDVLVRFAVQPEAQAPGSRPCLRALLHDKDIPGSPLAAVRLAAGAGAGASSSGKNYFRQRLGVLPSERHSAGEAPTAPNPGTTAPASFPVPVPVPVPAPMPAPGGDASAAPLTNGDAGPAAGGGGSDSDTDSAVSIHVDASDTEEDEEEEGVSVLDVVEGTTSRLLTGEVPYRGHGVPVTQSDGDGANGPSTEASVSLSAHTAAPGGEEATLSEAAPAAVVPATASPVPAPAPAPVSAPAPAFAPTPEQPPVQAHEPAPAQARAPALALSATKGAPSAEASPPRPGGRRGREQWMTLPPDSILVALRLACCTFIPLDAVSAGTGSGLLRSQHPLLSDTAERALWVAWPPGVMPHLGGFSALLDALPVMAEGEAEMLESGVNPQRLEVHLQRAQPLARLQEQVSVIRGGIALGADAQRIRDSDSESEDADSEGSDSGEEGDASVSRRTAVLGAIRAAGTMALSARRARRRLRADDLAATQRLLPHRHFASFDSSAMAVVPWIAPRVEGAGSDTESSSDLGREAVLLTDRLRGVHAAADAAASAVRRLLEGPREEEAVPALPAPPTAGDWGAGPEGVDEGGEERGEEEGEDALAAQIEAMYGMEASSDEESPADQPSEPSTALQPAGGGGAMSERARQLLARTMGGGSGKDEGAEAPERHSPDAAPQPRAYAEARAIDAERLMGLVSAAAATALPPADDEPRHWTAWRDAAAAWRPGSSPSHLAEVASLLRRAPATEVQPRRRDVLCSVLEAAAAADRAASPAQPPTKAGPTRSPAIPLQASPARGHGLALQEHEANMSLVGGRSTAPAERAVPDSPVDKRLLPASIIESLTQEIQRAVTAASHMIVSDSTSEGEGGEGTAGGRRGKRAPTDALARVGAPRRRVDWARDMTRLESLLLQLLPADRARAIRQEAASSARSPGANHARGRPQRRGKRSLAPPPPPPPRSTPASQPARPGSSPPQQQQQQQQQQGTGSPTAPVSLRVARRAAARAKHRQEAEASHAGAGTAASVVQENGVPALSASQMGELSRHIPPELLHYLKEPLAPPEGAAGAEPAAAAPASVHRAATTAGTGAGVGPPGPASASSAAHEDATSVSTTQTTSDAASRRRPRRRRGRSQSKGGRRSRSRSRSGSGSGSGSRSDTRRGGQRDAEALLLGCRVELQDGTVGTVRYVGPTSFAPGQWLGLELDNATGTCDGSARGVRYFTCRQTGPSDAQRGVFAPRAHVRRIVGVEDSDSDRAEGQDAHSPARGAEAAQAAVNGGDGHARAGRELVGALAALAATPDADRFRRWRAAQSAEPAAATDRSASRSGRQGDGKRRRGAPPPPPRSSRRDVAVADRPPRAYPGFEQRSAPQPPPPPRRDASGADLRARVDQGKAGDQGSQFRWARDGKFGEQVRSPPAPPPSREATATEPIHGVGAAWNSTDEAGPARDRYMRRRATGIEDTVEEGGMSDSELERLLQGTAPSQ